MLFIDGWMDGWMNFTSPRAGQQKLRSWAARESFTSESERCRFCFCTRMPRSAAKGRTTLMSYWQAGCTCWGQTTSCNVTSRCRWPFSDEAHVTYFPKEGRGRLSLSLTVPCACLSRPPVNSTTQQCRTNSPAWRRREVREGWTTDASPERPTRLQGRGRGVRWER